MKRSALFLALVVSSAAIPTVVQADRYYPQTQYPGNTFQKITDPAVAAWGFVKKKKPNMAAVRVYRHTRDLSSAYYKRAKKEYNHANNRLKNGGNVYRIFKGQ
jgi:hypothetical protein